ncbi:MAG: GNAT family N-acetyltransferase [Pirellulales bacterium]
MSTEVIIHFLEMARDDFRPAHPPDAASLEDVGPGALTLQQAEIPLPALNKFLYAEVGRDWQWTDRLGWSDADWREYVERPGLETWVGYLRGTPYGYFELDVADPRDVQLAYFGLLPGFLGRRLGGYLLSESIRLVFDRGAERYWVHTCTLDHPGALPNYVKRGFREYKQEKEWK